MVAGLEVEALRPAVDDVGRALALRRKVDVITEDGLSPFIRQRVLSEAVAL